MATLITKNSSTASAVPAAGDLVKGELAVNVTDKKVYTKDNSAAVVKLVGSLGNQEASAVAITGGTINGTTIGATTPSTGAFTTASASSGFTGNLTGNVTGNVSGTASNVTGVVAIANGGTGLSSLGTGVQTALGQNVTGSGSIVLATSPSLTTPNLGTPSAAVLTNATGLPLTTGVTGTLGVANGGTGITAFGTGVATALGQNVTGSGGIVLATSPSLTTPNLGTPSAVTLTNATGLPISTGVSGLGTGVATALAVNTGSSGAFVVNGGALGTPSSGTLTNATGLPLSTGVTGTLATTNGGTGLTSFTANGVVYASSSSALTTGSALTFDGSVFQTSLGVGLVTNTKQLVLNNFSGEGVGITFSRPTDSTEVNAIGTASSFWELGLFGREGIVFATGGGGTYSSTTEAMRLTSTSLYTASGINVAIGASLPRTKLDVRGNGIVGGVAKASADSDFFSFSSSENIGSGFRLGVSRSAAGSGAYYSLQVIEDGVGYRDLSLQPVSGNVGIGTSSPSKKLEVANSDALIYGITVGRGAGAVSTNTAVGASALASGSLSGGTNTGVGYFALNANTTGANNTAVANGAMEANTTGTENSAFGSRALRFNETGSYNSAFGRDALFSNTTASNNTAVGYQAGYSNQTGQYNTFIGYQAGYTSNFNGGTGANTCVGTAAGNSLTTGNRNTFVGALSSIGYGAGYLVTTGSNNTILGGYNGNQGGLDIRTASNYVVLSDGDGNPRGIFDNSGNWLVGTTSATSRTGVTAMSVSYTTSQDVMYATNNDNAYFVLCSHIRTTSGTRYHIGFGDGTTWTERGTISTNGTSTSYNTSSDYRLKNITGPVTGSGAYIDSLKPVEGTWKADGSTFVGLIAHEAQEVSRTQVATGEKDGERMQAMDYSNAEFIANIIAELQSLRARVAQLESKGA